MQGAFRILEAKEAPWDATILELDRTTCMAAVWKTESFEVWENELSQ